MTDAPTTTARIIDMETGSVELREFASSADARRSFAREAGRLLIWTQGDTRWTATHGELEYQVDMDHLPEKPEEPEEKGPAEEAGTPAEA